MLRRPGRSTSQQQLPNYLVDHQLFRSSPTRGAAIGGIDQLPPDLQTAYSHTFLQAITEGIGIQFGSGDNGDEPQGVGVRTVDSPPAIPG